MIRKTVGVIFMLAGLALFLYTGGPLFLQGHLLLGAFVATPGIAVIAAGAVIFDKEGVLEKK